MDAKTAKRIPITDYLGSLGHQPAAVRGPDRWYRSPLRDEKTASFKVDAVRNLWFDHGEGVGGTIIDLAMRLNGDPSVAAAIRSIAGAAGGSLPLPFRPEASRPAPDAKAPGSVAENVGPLSDPRLVAYLEGVRAIPLSAAAPYVSELRYRTADGKRYAAIAFQNRSGGFELRSPNFKGTFGTKDVTVVGDPHDCAVRAFEGFSDFLSAQVLWPEEGGLPAVVLNSVAMAERAAEEIRQRGCRAVCNFDADLAGTRALAVFRETLGEGNAADARGRLDGCKDLNDLLVRVAKDRGNPRSGSGGGPA